MGIGVHQLAILQGSEVAHVERALVRAPAAFLGFEAHKEGHHFRSCKLGFCPAFLFHGYVRAISPSSPHQTGLDHLVETDSCSLSEHPVAPRTTVGSSPQRRTWIAPRSSCRSEPGSRPDHHRITSRYHAQTVVDLFRNAKFDPHSNPLAAPNLGSPRPDTAPKPLRGDRKQKIGSNCNFFAISDCYGLPRSRIAVKKRR